MKEQITAMDTTKPAALQQISPVERALIANDLSALTESERIEFYKDTCASLGLNPMTQPFGYIEFWNSQVKRKVLTLYAKADCSAQLRKRDKISIEEIDRGFIANDQIFYVRVKATTADQVDFATGAVFVGGLTGADLVNAILKAETKAKRRVTLSISGLSLPDETELETMPVVNDLDARIKTTYLNTVDAHEATKQLESESTIKPTTEEIKESREKHHPTTTPEEKKPNGKGVRWSCSPEYQKKLTDCVAVLQSYGVTFEEMEKEIERESKGKKRLSLLNDFEAHEVHTALSLLADQLIQAAERRKGGIV